MIPVAGRQRQEGSMKCEVSVGYIVTTSPARDPEINKKKGGRGKEREMKEGRKKEA